MSTPKLSAEADARMLLARLSLRDYFGYIALTIAGKGAGGRVKR
jgi:hypothetical protein